MIAGAIALLFRSTEIEILQEKLNLIFNSSIFAGENFTELEYLTTKRPPCQSLAVNLITKSQPEQILLDRHVMEPLADV